MTVGVFGLGGMELLILAIWGLAPLVIVAVVLFVVLGRRARGPGGVDLDHLRAEVDRLRADVERLKQGRT